VEVPSLGNFWPLVHLHRAILIRRRICRVKFRRDIPTTQIPSSANTTLCRTGTVPAWIQRRRSYLRRVRPVLVALLLLCPRLLRPERTASARQAMPLRRGAPLCRGRPSAGSLCAGGGRHGSAPARSDLLRRACFLRPADKSGGAIRLAPHNAHSCRTNGGVFFDSCKAQVHGIFLPLLEKYVLDGKLAVCLQFKTYNLAQVSRFGLLLLHYHIDYVLNFSTRGGGGFRVDFLPANPHCHSP
jgi:hypothetical protein